MEIERTRGEETLLLFDAGIVAHVEESTRDIQNTLEVITWMQLSADFSETLGLGEMIRDEMHHLTLQKRITLS